MIYDFDEVINRKGTDCVKWDAIECDLPMWVADMDFKAAPEIVAAMRKKLDHGVFGYTIVPDDWYDAYISWWRRRHGLEIKREWLMFCEGILPALSSLVKKFTRPGQKVILQTPVYNHFIISIKNNGREILENPLVLENGRYRMDLDDLERKMAGGQAPLMIISNPHNPTCNIWGRDDLERIGSLAKRYGVTVISDEIHCDIVRPGMGYVPFASVSDECRDVSISCISPTKSFNLAGIKTAAVIAANDNIRSLVSDALKADEISDPGVFSCPAAIAAFEQGEEWLDQMNEYVFRNRRLAEEFIDEEIPDLSVIRGDATYLLWIDISMTGRDSKSFSHFLKTQTGLFVSPGELYGEAGDKYLRMNIACPKELLMEGLGLLKAGAVKAHLI